ncbi:hypothetical protein [Phocaeicola coprophilus]|uniref:hypothetical protein n=1 Tax=Phocaeicola coprophilus TaxID=387090 RepID=UPI0026DAFC50|nr:hypothetical protein [Phocaeicola coprophilus]
MKRILLLGLFICNLLGLETIAQNITGSIINKQNEKLPYTAIAVIERQNNKLIDSAICDSLGVFRLKSRSEYPDGIVLYITNVGYKNMWRSARKHKIWEPSFWMKIPYYSVK